MKIIYKKNIICNYDERLQTIILTGPLGSVSIYIEKLYGGHTKNSITLIPSKSTNYLVSRLKQFEDGLTIGFTKRIYQAGVWNQAQFNKNTGDIQFKLGLSHPVSYKIPKNVILKSTRESGQDRKITLLSIDKELVATSADKIYNLKKPEVYKGTGFRYAGQIIRRKVGKKK